MVQLLGEYPCKVDAKGRLRLPSALVGQFEGGGPHTFTVNRGFENCVTLYPEKVWDEISKEVDELNPYDKRNRKFIRNFYRGATKVTLDGADRINLPNQLLEYAEIKNEVIVSAVKNKIEIWAKVTWDSMMNEEVDEDFSDLAQQVLGSKKSNGAKNADEE